MRKSSVNSGAKFWVKSLMQNGDRNFLAIGSRSVPYAIECDLLKMFEVHDFLKEGFSASCPCNLHLEYLLNSDKIVLFLNLKKNYK
jgi:hypothetical protein